MQTKTGVHYGLYQDKPAQPAPTLLIIANGVDASAADPKRFYTATGIELARHGWIYVVLDPPCEGYLRKEGEPAGLNGWAYYLKAGRNFIEPYARGCSDVLDQLVADGYADPERIAVSGTSRGGFSAFHFAARDPRVKVVTAVSPVTNPRALAECKDVSADEARPVDIDSYAERLAGRTVWLTIGNDDQRVNSDDAIRLAQKIIAATKRKYPEQPLIPVTLIVGPSPGHRAIDDVYALEAAFLQKTFGK
jgi:dienelactone hydrolase